MTITVEDVQKALPKYAKLDETQIETAIDLASGYLVGVNADWERHPECDKALLLASISMTLKLHFPQQVETFNALDNNVVEMLTSVWSSSLMKKNKNRYMRIVGERDDCEGKKYIIAKGRSV